MILATHAIAGAALAAAMPNRPMLAFVAGGASHFLLDAIPHWDYELRSSRKDMNNPLNDDIVMGRDFWFDLIKISGDALFGLALSWFFFRSFFTGQLGMLTFIAGTTGGLLPDALQFAYFKLRWPWLATLQQFHHWIHADPARKIKPLTGIPLQIFLVAAIVLTTKFIL